MSVAERVAAERAENLGCSTGYSVRFDSILPRSHAAIMFCTVGMYTTRLFINKPISGCIRMACDSLLTTSLLQVVNSCNLGVF